MVIDILKQQLSQLLGDLSLFYQSETILKNIKKQIESLEDVVDDGLYFKYVYDYEKLYNEYKELDKTVNEIVENSGKISNVINKVSNFNLTIDYFKSLGDDYSIIERYSKIIPDTLSRLDIYIENLETLQMAILNQSGGYILKKKTSTIEKIATVGLGVVSIYIIYRYLLKDILGIK